MLGYSQLYNRYVIFYRFITLWTLTPCISLHVQTFVLCGTFFFLYNSFFFFQGVPVPGSSVSNASLSYRYPTCQHKICENNPTRSVRSAYAHPEYGCTLVQYPLADKGFWMISISYPTGSVSSTRLPYRYLTGFESHVMNLDTLPNVLSIPCTAHR